MKTIRVYIFNAFANEDTGWKEVTHAIEPWMQRNMAMIDATDDKHIRELGWCSSSDDDDADYYYLYMPKAAVEDRVSGLMQVIDDNMLPRNIKRLNQS